MFWVWIPKEEDAKKLSGLNEKLTKSEASSEGLKNKSWKDF